MIGYLLYSPEKSLRCILVGNFDKYSHNHKQPIEGVFW
jgi:hypothetical protein